MIPIWLTALAFLSVAYLTKSRTYAVLALSSIFNIYIDHFTRSDDLYLMVTYSSIEFFTCLAVLYYGDSHKIYQSVILFMMLCLHFIMEVALDYDYSSFIESGLYTYTMSGLIIAQLIGAGRGMDRTSYWPDSNRRETHYLVLFNHQSTFKVKEAEK